MAPQAAAAVVNDELLVVVQLFSPLLVGFAADGLVIKFGWLESIRRPIDRGVTLKGKPLFGPNKTYRGIVAVALGTGVACSVQALVPSLAAPELSGFNAAEAAFFGLILGAGAMCAELPNSLLKRQLGIGSGRPGRGWLRPLFYVFDQLDVLVGAWIVLLFTVQLTSGRLLWSLAFFLVAHQILSFLGYALGMRTSPR